MKLATRNSRGAHAAPRRAQAGKIAYGLLWVVLIAAGFIAWPAQFGGQTGYTIVSGKSMEPTYHTGDLLITRPADQYATGDIVVYQVPEGEPGAGYHVVHRIVGGNNEDGFITRGDNNSSDDIWLPTSKDIAGKVELVVGKGGYVLRQTRNPLLYALLGALLVGQILWPRNEDENENDENEDDEPKHTPPAEPLVVSVAGGVLPEQAGAPRSESIGAAGALSSDLAALDMLLGVGPEEKRVLASLDERELAHERGESHAALPMPLSPPRARHEESNRVPTLAEQLYNAMNTSETGHVNVELVPDPATGVLRYQISPAELTLAPLDITQAVAYESESTNESSNESVQH